MTPIEKNDMSNGNNNAESSNESSSLSPELRAFIKKEIDSHLQNLIREVLVPEIRKILIETVQEGLEKTPPVETSENLQSTPQIEQEFLPPVEEEILPLDDISSTKLDETKPVIPITEIRIGIDFGTSTTAVSLRIGEEQPQALPIGRNGEKYIPSVVYFRSGNGELSERVLVGEEAEAISDESRVIRSVKRCIGCNGANCFSQQIKKFPWCIGDGNIQIGQSETLPPSDVAFFIVQEALGRALKIIRENNNVNLEMSNINLVPVNLGCGANFNLAQRKIILELAKKLGFDINIKNIVEEPILAGFAFSRFSEAPEGRSVIYDFGGGTLDIAVVDVSRKNGKPFVTVLATAGENWLGGDDIDTIVYDEFISQIEKDLNVGKGEVEKYLEVIDHIKLRQKARVAKERLSSRDHFEDSFLLEQFGMTPLSLTKARFNEMLIESKLVQKSMDAMLRALKLAYALRVAQTSNLLDVSEVASLQLTAAANEVEKVVLVGGVTKIPLIQQEIRKIFGDSKVVEEKVFDPISAVAIGAAYPKEADHFSISSPPYGFYLEGIQQGQTKRNFLAEPFVYFEFYKMIHANSVPTYSIPFTILDEYKSVILKGKEPLVQESTVLKDLGNLEPGNYFFHIGLDGSLTLVDKSSKPHYLGVHPYTHPLQNRIKEERERRQAEANKYPDRSLSDDYINLMNEN